MSVSELLRVVCVWAFTFVAATQLASDFWNRRMWLAVLLIVACIGGLVAIVDRGDRVKMVTAVVGLSGFFGLGRTLAVTLKSLPTIEPMLLLPAAVYAALLGGGWVMFNRQEDHAPD